MGYYIDQLAEQDRQKRLAELLSMQQDNSEPGVQFDTGQQRQFLSALADPNNTIRTAGFDPQGTTGRGEPYMPPQPLPQNFIRNEQTGAVTDLGQSQFNRPVGDMGQVPVDTPFGRGYYLKGDNTRVVLADGRIADLGRDTTKDRAIEKENLTLQKLRKEVNARPESTYDKEMAKNRAKAAADKEAAGIPGTTEYDRILKQKEASDAVGKRRTSAVESSDSTLDAIKNAREKIGFFTTGLTGQIARNIGGTDALNLNEALEPIRASLAFDRLQQMREESKTGGALGQVAVQELEMLQKSKASLNQAQTQEQLEKALYKIEGHYQRYRAAMSQARANGEFGNQPSTPEKSGAEQQAILMQEAQQAIAAGASRDAVMQRLQEKLRGR